MLHEGRIEDDKRQMRHAAFITYSLGAGEGGKTYQSYLSELGLIESSGLPKKQKAKIAKKAKMRAAEIIELMKKRSIPNA